MLPSFNSVLNSVRKGLRKVLRQEEREVKQGARQRIRKKGFTYFRPQKSSTVTQARARIPTEDKTDKIDVTAESFWRDLSDEVQYQVTTWRPFLKDKKSRSESTLNQLFIALKGGPFPVNENQRSIVGIDRVRDANASYNLNVIEEGIFPKLTEHPLDPLAKKVTALIRGLGKKEAGLGYLVSPKEPSGREGRESDGSVEETKSDIRAIEDIERPNRLYLRIMHDFAVHLLNADPDIQDRAERAKQLREEGIDRNNMIEIIDRFLEWMALDPPLIIVWRNRGTDCNYLMPMDSITKKRILVNTSLKRVSIRKRLSNNLKSLKQYLKDQFKIGRQKKFETDHPIWKLIATRVARNFRDFQSLFAPEIYIETQLKPVLTKLFMQDEEGNPGKILTEENRQKLEEILKEARVCAEMDKIEMEKRYPKHAEEWVLMEKIYTQCKTALDSARQKAADVSLEREKKYPEMSDQEKIRFRERMEEKLVSPVKKKYPLTVKPLSPFPFPFDAKTLSDDAYSERFSNQKMERLSPTSIIESTPFVRLITFWILPANTPRNRNEDLAGLLYRLGLSLESLEYSPFEYD